MIRDELPQRLERTLVQLHRHITDTTKERLHAIRRRPLLKPSNDTLNCGASTIRQVVEQVRDLPEQRPDQRVNVLKQRRPKPAHGRAHVLERALSRVASLKRRTADTLLHRLSENVERDLPLRPQILGLSSRDAHNVGDHLPDGDTRGEQLHRVVALQLALRRDRTPDQAHIAQLAPSNSRRVRSQREDPLKLLARLDTRRNQRARQPRRLIQTERRALHRAESVSHNRLDRLRRMAQARQLRLCLLNR